MSDKSRKFIGPNCAKVAANFIRRMAKTGEKWSFGMNTTNLSIVVKQRGKS